MSGCFWLGESGCGKSTLLLVLQFGFGSKNLENLFEDEKTFLDEKRTSFPGELGMKLVSQNYDLMPYLTAAENIGKFISNTNLSEKKKIRGFYKSSWT